MQDAGRMMPALCCGMPVGVMILQPDVPTLLVAWIAQTVTGQA